VAKEGPGYQPPPCVTPLFADVPCTDPFARWINELANRGITAGCGGGNFCPTNTVSHGQMAVFLLRTWETGYTAPPATCSPLAFADVACTDPFAPWIEEIFRRGIWPGCGGGSYCPTQPVTRAQMAVLLSRTFGIPVETPPNLPRTVTHDYDDGLLTNVSGYGALSYHPNGMWNQVQHANRVTDTQANDPNAMRRPASLSAAFGAAQRWSTGTYSFDGAGNITRLGTTTWFLYDKVNRLVQGNLDLAPTGAGAQLQQSYTFDPFGNLQAIAGASGRNTPTNPDTNRLTGSTVYDGAGNLTSWNGATYEYDAFHQMTRMVSGAEEWRYAYTADDERAWLFKVGGNLSRWTLRDLANKVLREYLNDGGIWSTASDYVYRDGQLLAAETATGPRHFHLDHLGTPRLITDRAGRQAAYHVYFPFGEEATAFNQDAERMKFTGHERDLASAAGAGDDLDSMHARHCSPVVGRFLSVDPIQSAKPGIVQSWNRYAYAWNNPLRHLDLDGLETGDFATPPAEKGPPRTNSEALSDVLVLTGAAYSAIGGTELVAGARGLTAGAASFGEGLALIGARFQGVLEFFRNIGAGLTGAPTVGKPISGDFERTLSTSNGELSILANAATEGATLILRDAAVYGDKAKATLGAPAVLGAVRELGTELAARGYTTLVIQGFRYSGVNPGRTQTIIVDLTKLAK
jgi:RHS repeat-associated protein